MAITPEDKDDGIYGCLGLMAIAVILVILRGHLDAAAVASLLPGR
jgi:hypothetical protein